MAVSLAAASSTFSMDPNHHHQGGGAGVTPPPSSNHSSSQPGHHPQVTPSHPSSQVSHQQTSSTSSASSPGMFAPWTPSPNAAPFYPAFPGPWPAGMPTPPPGGVVPGQGFVGVPPGAVPAAAGFPPGAAPAFFDPNQQFAAWAYQQMLFTAQQQQQQQFAQMMPFAGGQPFPGGAPPSPQQQAQQQQQLQPGQPGGVPGQPGPQHQGFHPYRRPGQGGSNGGSGNRSQDSSPTSASHPDWRGHAQNPSSASSATGSLPRQRTNSNQSSTTSPSVRGGAQPPTRSASASPVVSSPRPTPHSRTGSSSSNVSSASTPNARTNPSTGSPNTRSATLPNISTNNSNSSSGSLSAAAKRPAKPSPLSQAQVIDAPPPPAPVPREITRVRDPNRRLSRDDSELTDAPSPLAGHTYTSSRGTGGLKSRLRRALSFNAIEEIDSPGPQRFTEGSGAGGGSNSNEFSPPNSPDTIRRAGTPMPISSGKPKRSLFNKKFNASTDNISLSSTVSSASVMIRKLGGLVRRDSLMSITSVFKGKDKDKDGEGKKEKKSKKGVKAEASVSHATVEFESGTSGITAEDLAGLTPAAKLARQHTLRSNAEAAARANAAKAGIKSNGVPTWEKNTVTRSQQSPAAGSSSSAAAAGPPRRRGVYDSGSDEYSDEDGQEDDGSDEEDTTLRIGGGLNGAGGSGAGRGEGAGGAASNAGTAGSGKSSVDGGAHGAGGGGIGAGERGGMSIDGPRYGTGEGEEAWAIGLRRSVERTRVPKRGILKGAGTYTQDAFLDPPPNPPFSNRFRSNSYNTGPGEMPGPLARIPSPDPDHIDGLVGHAHSASSTSGPTAADAEESLSSSPVTGPVNGLESARGSPLPSNSLPPPSPATPITPISATPHTTHLSTPSTSSSGSPLKIGERPSSQHPGEMSFTFDFDFGGGLDLLGETGSPLGPPVPPSKDSFEKSRGSSEAAAAVDATPTKPVGRTRSGSVTAGGGGGVPRPSYAGSDASVSTLTGGSSNSSHTSPSPGTTPTSSSIPTFSYTHPSLNSSAPVLSTLTTSSSSHVKGSGMGVNQGPKKKLSFAANLSIYETFSPGAYDRRSEPATCNRLTPALAQRIKEELNAYKMEEMEVHASSRVHTHFFV